MAWIGASICFLGWVGYGWWLKDRTSALQAKMRRTSRPARVFYGSGGLVLGLLFLIVGMYFLAMTGGASSRSIQLWAWPFIFMIGLLFIHTQVWGACALVSLVLPQVPDKGPDASVSSETQP
jgi:hypothetical protein